ncbi:hypothetical protein J521_2669 [Acinetobacter baumannii 1035119]|nr:hypothetical protein J521_2669 [Acinetobacter baumannii 1035119]
MKQFTVRILPQGADFFYQKMYKYKFVLISKSYLDKITYLFL